MPTRAAAEQLRRTLEELTVTDKGWSTLAGTNVLTRDEWYQAMAERAEPSVPLLSQIDRTVCMTSATKAALKSGAKPPFKLRPELIPSIVAFYDDLMRHQQSVKSFERLMVSDLEPSVELDRGARRLLRQTHFLAATFRFFQREIVKAGRLDEHGLREKLIDRGMRIPFVRVVVTTADYVADPDGLWPTDFDLLTRLPGLERIDVVATDNMLNAGFHQRVAELFPGIEEEDVQASPDVPPVLVTPTDDQLHFVSRDREGELLGVARAIKGQSRAVDGAEAVVFQRRLPYLYLAQEVFEQARIPFQTQDSLPLVGESYAAALDLVVEFVTSDYSRSSMVALLRSPQFAFKHEGRLLPSVKIEALDRALHGVRYSGGRLALGTLVDKWVASDKDGRGLETPCAEWVAAAVVAAELAEELRSLETPGPPSELLDRLMSFLKHHRANLCDTSTPTQRASNARSQIWTGLAALRSAYLNIDDTPTEFSELTSSIRRWIENQTYSAFAGSDGIQLIDARAASYGRFRELFIVGLIDDEWPERPARSIFYPTSLLTSLGWTRDRDRLRAARARFLDLMSLARERVSLSTFSLEEDAVVTPSNFLEQLADVGLLTIREPLDLRICVTSYEALARGSVAPEDLPGRAKEWLSLREHRPAQDQSRCGIVGACRVQTYAVSALEQYLDCPFKYFAHSELQLEEELMDEPTLSPRQRGLLLHGILETFFSKWQESGEQAITLANMGRALESFRNVVEESVLTLPIEDRAVIRSWLLGSAAAPGIAERLCMLEISRPAEVVERLLEFRVEGPFILQGGDRQRTAHIRGTTDRLDLLSDGTFRVIDYKANRAPHHDRALQLAVYARCAEQQLDGYQRSRWSVSDAGYVAFGEPRLYVPLANRNLGRELAQGESRAIDVLDQITHGVFPARPAEPQLCTHCAYPTVCRKNYVRER